MKTVETTITDLAYGGDGVGRVDGKVVFIPAALPGETVIIEIVEQKRDFARGRLVEVKVPAAGRIKPRCRHFGVCGGCQLQHLSYQDQLRAKERWVKTRLDRLQKEPIEWLPTVGADKQWGYRERIQIHRANNGGWGFQRAKSHEVIPIAECPIADATLQPPYAIESKADRVERTAVKAAMRTVSGLKLRASPDSFLQVHAEQNQRLVAAVVELAGKGLGGRVVWDLYAGIGNFSLPLARLAGRVMAVEGNKSAARDCESNAEANGITNVTVLADDVAAAVNDLTGPALVVLDPPREGAKAVMELIPEEANVLYVSCDPATLERDLKMLIARGFRIQVAQVFDLFPQTYHVESVVFLKRPARSG